MVPDRRRHRSSAPQDAEQLTGENESRLSEATAQYAWLLSRGYATRSALKLVGDRHGLTARQREALARCACTDEQREHRRVHPTEHACHAVEYDAKRSAQSLLGKESWIDVVFQKICAGAQNVEQKQPSQAHRSAHHSI